MSLDKPEPGETFPCNYTTVAYLVDRYRALEAERDQLEHRVTQLNRYVAHLRQVAAVPENEELDGYLRLMREHLGEQEAELQAERDRVHHLANENMKLKGERTAAVNDPLGRRIDRLEAWARQLTGPSRIYNEMGVLQVLKPLDEVQP